MTIRIERLRARRTTIRIDVHRFASACILAGYGIFILSLFARNVMSLYINPSYIGPTTLAGAVLVGLATVRVGRGGAACEHGCCETDDCGCGDTKPRFHTYALLCLPLILGLLFPPRGLASFSANQRGTQIAGMTVLRGVSGVKHVTLSVDTRSFSMMDWVGALSADPNPKDYQGKPVHITGVVLRNPGSAPPGYIMVMRYLVTCCIADARAVGLLVRDTTHGGVQDDEWVTVTGAMSAAHTDGQDIAVVAPTKIVPAKTGNPYIY